MSNRSRWRKMKAGDKEGVGVVTCACCMRAVDKGEDVTCNDCVTTTAEIAYANGRADGRLNGGGDE